MLDQSASFLQDLSRDGLSIDSEGVVREQGETVIVLINEREISLNLNVATKILAQATTPRQPANAPGPA